MQRNVIVAFVGVLGFLLLQCANLRASVILNSAGEAVVHYGFKTDNGQTRTEDIKYNQTKVATTEPSSSPSASSSSADASPATAAGDATTAGKKSSAEDDYKPVEYRGGYSFISADGYEYTVLYKANKNGFQPYVTAHKITAD